MPRRECRHLTNRFDAAPQQVVKPVLVEQKVRFIIHVWIPCLLLNCMELRCPKLEHAG